MLVVGNMWTLLSAVCFGLAAIGQALNNTAARRSFEPQANVPVAPSPYLPNGFLQYTPPYPAVPVVPQADSFLPYYAPSSDNGRNTGAQYQPNPAPVVPQADIPPYYFPVVKRNRGKASLALPPVVPPNVLNPVPSGYQYKQLTNHQSNGIQEQPSHCANSDILFKIWTILWSLFDTGGIVKDLDAENVKHALNLIKDYIKKAPQNDKNKEVAKKLLMLENDLLKDKDIPETKLALRTNTDNIDTDPLTPNHKTPENVKLDCKEELAKVIQTAQKSYSNLVNSPICSTTDKLQSLLRRNDVPVTSHNYFNSENSQNQHKHVEVPNTNNSNANYNDVLKSSLELLKNQTSYNANDIFELLQNYKPVKNVEQAESLATDETKQVNDSNPIEKPFPSQASDFNIPTSLNNNPAFHAWTSDAKPSKMKPPNDEIELTYALKRPQPVVYQPLYYIKYRLPFRSFLKSLSQITPQKPIKTSKSDLYKSIIQNWNADVIPPDLVHFTKEQVNDLVMEEGSLVETKLIQNKYKHMPFNIDSRGNLENEHSNVDFGKVNTENGDGKHFDEEQASPYNFDYSRRKNFISNIRLGLDSVPKLPRYPSMVQKGPAVSPLDGFNHDLLQKYGISKINPVAEHLPSPLIST